MGEVIDFKTKKVVVDPTEEEREVWMCDCDCMLFYVYTDGFQCATCEVYQTFE